MKSFYYLEKLVELDKELLDHALLMEMATKYKRYSRYNYHTFVRQEAEKELKELKAPGDEKNER